MARRENAAEDMLRERLSEDPAGVFARLDAASQAVCLRQLAQLAARLRRPDTQVAEAALRLASADGSVCALLATRKGQRAVARALGTHLPPRWLRAPAEPPLMAETAQARVLIVLHAVVDIETPVESLVHQLLTARAAFAPGQADCLLLADPAPCPTAHSSRDDEVLRHVLAALANADRPHARMLCLMRARSWEPGLGRFAGAGGRGGALSILQMLLEGGHSPVVPAYLSEPAASLRGRWDAVLVLGNAALCPSAARRMLGALMLPANGLPRVRPRLMPDSTLSPTFAGLLDVCAGVTPPVLCLPGALCGMRATILPDCDALAAPPQTLADAVCGLFAGQASAAAAGQFALLITGALARNPFLMLLALLLTLGRCQADSPAEALARFAAHWVLLPTETAAWALRAALRFLRRRLAVSPTAARQTELRCQAVGALLCALPCLLARALWAPSFAAAGVFAAYPLLHLLLDRPRRVRPALPKALRSPLADLARAAMRCLDACMDALPLPPPFLTLRPDPTPEGSATQRSVGLCLLGCAAACELGLMDDDALQRRLTRLADVLTETDLPPAGEQESGGAAWLFLGLRCAAACAAEDVLAAQLTSLAGRVRVQTAVTPAAALAKCAAGQLPPEALLASAAACPDRALLAFAALAAPMPGTALRRRVRQAVRRVLRSEPDACMAALCLPHAPRRAARVLRRLRSEARLTTHGFPDASGQRVLLTEQALLLLAVCALATGGEMTRILADDPTLSSALSELRRRA